MQRNNSLAPARHGLTIASIFTMIFLFAAATSAAPRPKPAGKLNVGKRITGTLDQRSDIRKDDPEQPRIVHFQLAYDGNETITIDAESDDFNARLRLIDSAGRIVAEDDDGGIGHNSRLVISAKQFSSHEAKDLRVELTSQGDWDTGIYSIAIMQGEHPAPLNKENINASIEYCERAAEKAQGKSEQRRGWVLATMAWNYSLLGKFDVMQEKAQAARAIAEKVGDRRLMAVALKNIGAADWYRGRAEAAIPYFEVALQIRRELGDRKGEANSLDNLGIAYQQMGKRLEAIKCFEQALEICRAVGDRRGEGNELGNLGIAFYSIGDHNRAIDFYEQALKIRREIGDRRGEAYDLGNIGVVYAKMGQYQRAIVYYELAVKICRELGDRRGEGRELGNLYKACVFVGDFKKAIELKKEADRINSEVYR